MTKFQLKCARSPLAFALGLALLGGAPPAWAASDILMRIEGVPGETSAKEMEIQSFGFGESHIGEGCRGASGPGEATLTAATRLPTGKVIKKAILHMRKSGGDGTAAIELENVMISSARAGRAMRMTYAKATWSAPNCLAAR